MTKEAIEAFDEWLESRAISTEKRDPKEWGDVVYKHAHVQSMFDGWNAAMAHKAIPLHGEINSKIDEIVKSYSLDIRDLPENIHCSDKLEALYDALEVKINGTAPRDIEGLKREAVEFAETNGSLFCKDHSHREILQAFVDHLSPRILKPGFVMVPEKVTPVMMLEFFRHWNNDKETFQKAFDALIQAAKEGGE